MVRRLQAVDGVTGSPTRTTLIDGDRQLGRATLRARERAVEATGRDRSNLWGRAGSVVLLVAAAGYPLTALLIRQGSPLTRTIWAEDGREFLARAYLDSSPGAWLQSYTGYLHVLPRMIAALVAPPAG